ncbi:unnamed protein product [Lepidochelys kempii]
MQALGPTSNSHMYSPPGLLLGSWCWTSLHCHHGSMAALTAFPQLSWKLSLRGIPASGVKTGRPAAETPPTEEDLPQERRPRGAPGHAPPGVISRTPFGDH